MVRATTCIAEGPKPVLIKFESKDKEIAWVVERAIETGKTSSTAIICRTRADIDEFARAFSEKAIKGVYLTTFHASKGLEFENVFIPFLNRGKLPDPDTVARAVSEKDAYADEIKLLYVAATRSKYSLYMTYSSVLTPLFPAGSRNVDYYNEEDIL